MKKKTKTEVLFKKSDSHFERIDKILADSSETDADSGYILAKNLDIEFGKPSLIENDMNLLVFFQCFNEDN